MALCLVTGAEDAKIIQSMGASFFRIESPALGGQYVVQGDEIAQLQKLSQREKSSLARWIVDEMRLGAADFSITSEVLASLKSRPPLSVAEKMQRFYMFLGSRSKDLAVSIPWNPYGYMGEETTTGARSVRYGAIAWTESQSEAELEQIAGYAKAKGYIESGAYAGEIMLTVDGWSLLEELSQVGSKPKQAFVAMWFGPEVSSAYEEGIAPAILDAGYLPMRIDQKEHSNRIDDEIIAEIRRSRFLIADFTCGVVKNGGDEVAIPRGGVYYEAGFAQGLGIPVIWMCREDHINHVHFDTRQFNHITWKDPADLREKLKNRIGAVLGDGPLISR